LRSPLGALFSSNSKYRKKTHTRSHVFLGWTNPTSDVLQVFLLSFLEQESNSQKFTMSIYLSRSFPRSNSSFQLSSGNALQSEVVRWQRVFGTGSAILAAFLALAGAAWSLDLTNLLSLNLLGAIYWLFIYLSIYIDILRRKNE